MKELNNHEVQLISGGLEIAFFLSIISGAKGYSLKNTVINSAIWGGIIGGIVGLPMMIVGAVITAPIGAAFGAVEGFVGYKIGSFLCDD